MSNKHNSKTSEPQSTYLTDDGFATPTVGTWAEYKYRFIGFYNSLFSTGMKTKWNQRVYIDLFAGSGMARIKTTNKLVLTSPMIALNVSDKYDRYIFCDEDERSLADLQKRVNRDHPRVDVHFVLGDCNKKINEIVKLIPQHSKTNKVLSFCFVDPFSLKIDFDTIRSLSHHFVDFLILLALAMDANRNEARYAADNNDRISKFLGLKDWRERWLIALEKDISFRRFLVREYANQMIKLRYLDDSAKTMIEVRSDDKNLPLYHLAFFSRNELGYKFWREGKQRIDEPELPFSQVIKMSQNSHIEWTDATWNPVTGCTKISPGCKHCYAETFAERFRGVPGHPYEQGFDLKLWPERLEMPLRWKEPKMIFVNSMSDLFHEGVSDDYIQKVFDVMIRADHHIFQLLTKRSERLMKWTSENYRRVNEKVDGRALLPKHIWLGVSIENEKYTSRIKHLQQVPARVRFLSIEPLLGPVELNASHLRGLHWVIVGGESGHKARPMNPEWAISVQRTCKRNNVAFFFKQWGAHNADGERVGKKAAGRLLNGRTWNEMPVHSV